ncbi:alpha/beta hydrolase [Desulfobacula sp.]|uniref:alpha/beta hydrolase n=1 Tax=Desulfobacula sp. TaxID=2593537 RepID=UPI0026029728|nr:alpha/beta hydrolase [Desulfobacula sp.]
MKLIVNVICCGILGYGLILVIFYFFQEKFLFFPGETPFGDCPEMEKRDIRAENSGGLRYYLQAKPKPDNWILVFHGNAGNACDRTYFSDLLKAFNSNLVLFEYPGYGKDANTPKESLILEQAHALILHIKGKNPDRLPIYLMGESLGTGVATFTASRTDVNGLILISPYTSIARLARHHYPWVPVKYLLKHPFPADIWAGRTRAPVLLFHGINDDIIPVAFARQQVLNFKGETTLVELPDCGHNDIIGLAGNRIQKELHDFMSNKEKKKH